MKKIKAYFFQKDLEEFKKLGVGKPTQRTSSILFVIDNQNQKAGAMIDRINTLMSSSKFRRYFLIYDPSNQLGEANKHSSYTKKDLNWRSGFSNLDAISLLKQAHHLVLFPQNIYRADFKFIAEASCSNFRIGHQAQALNYGLDIGFDLKNDSISEFIQQLSIVSPDLLERKGKKKSVLEKIDKS